MRHGAISSIVWRSVVCDRHDAGPWFWSGEQNADEEGAMVLRQGLFHHTMDPPYIKDRYEESILVIEAESEE